jgi:hypothetical protein
VGLEQALVVGNAILAVDEAVEGPIVSQLPNYKATVLKAAAIQKRFGTQESSFGPSHPELSAWIGVSQM